MPKEELPYFNLSIVITISDNNFSATINPFGAELTSLKSDNKEYIWEGDPEFWGKHSPVLFPIVGTLKNDTYTYDGKQYHLSRHGFAREKTFTITEQLSNSVTFKLSSDKDSLKVYPFNFELLIRYTLLNNSLILEYKVKNPEGVVMPFSIGAHPAFTLPGNFKDYSLQFTGTELITNKLDNGLLTSDNVTIPLQESKLFLNHELFKDDALVIKNVEAKEIIILKNNKAILKVSYPDFPDLGIWTKAGASFICIEPWHGYADSEDALGDIMEKEGIILLEGGKTFKSKFSIEIF